MTTQEAINIVDNMKPNAYTYEDKIRWLNELDGRVHEEVIKKAEDYDAESDTWEKYQDDDTESELLISDPYTNAYPEWIGLKIDYANGDINRYNNSVMTFSATYTDYQNWYRRNHIPARPRRWRL